MTRFRVRNNSADSVKLLLSAVEFQPQTCADYTDAFGVLMYMHYTLKQVSDNSWNYCGFYSWNISFSNDAITENNAIQRFLPDRFLGPFTANIVLSSVTIRALFIQTACHMQKYVYSLTLPSKQFRLFPLFHESDVAPFLVLHWYSIKQPTTTVCGIPRKRSLSFHDPHNEKLELIVLFQESENSYPLQLCSLCFLYLVPTNELLPPKW